VYMHQKGVYTYPFPFSSRTMYLSTERAALGSEQQELISFAVPSLIH